MKILHFNVYKHLLPGIKHQLIDEQSAAKSLNEDIEWSTIIFSLDSPVEPFMRKADISQNRYIPQKINNYISLKKQAYQWLIENQKKYDIILLRYFAGDPFLAFYMNKLNNVYTVHHTLEQFESKSSGGLIGYLHSKFDHFIAPYILKKAEGIIGVTNEIREYELNRLKKNKDSYTFPNGINTTSRTNLIDKRSDQVKIIFVASSFLPWHGLDIVQEQFKNSKLLVKLEVIGHVPDTLKIKDHRITYHGLRNKQYITSILKSADIGLSSFALERNNMNEACTLKVREYLSNGIPVYASHKDAALPENFPYYFNKPFTLEYANLIAARLKNTSRTKIIEASAEFIDKKEQMKHLSNWLKGLRINSESQN